MTNGQIAGALLKAAFELCGDATVIVYVARNVPAEEDTPVLDMVNSDHEMTAECIGTLAQWLASDVEEALEEST